MCDDTVDYFLTKGVYQRIGSDNESLFVCLPLSAVSLGKLVQYKTETPGRPDAIYENTGVSFLLNCYDITDIKSIFLDITNYELIGKLGIEFQLSNDKKYMYRGDMT